MKHLFKIVGFAAVAIAAVACTGKVESPKGFGEICINANSSSAVSLKNVSSDNTYTIEGLTLPASENFSLEMVSSLDDSMQSWSTIAEFSSETRYFASGSYTLKVAHGDPTIEGYDITPYFAGEKEITVEPRKTTNAVVPAYIQHALVAIECTEQFNSYFTSAAFKISTLAGAEFDVTLPMTKNLFIRPQQFAVECTAVKQTGEEVSLPKQIFTAINPQTRYTVKFDVAQAGGATIEITLNNTLVGEIVIENELNDDALPE